MIIVKLRCRFCKSKRIIKYGTRHNKGEKKQLYLCKLCNKKFTMNNGFLYAKYSSDLITVALDCYVRGMSMRDTASHIELIYGVRPSPSTVLEWIRRYGSMIESYTKKLKPKLGSVWMADEMQLDFRRQKNWLWVVEDKKTRFMMVCNPTLFKVQKNANAAFEKASKFGTPEAVITDGAHFYPKAIQELGEDVKHIRSVGCAGEKAKNTRIERLNGTIRQREKVMRGMHNSVTAKDIMRAFQIHYNFVRPNMALNGKTPAQAAGLNPKLGENKWRGLIKKGAQSYARAP